MELSRSIRALSLLWLLLLFCDALSRGQERTIFVFTNSPNCNIPNTELVTDAGGNLYGGTLVGGTYNKGCIFELSPSANGWQQTVLYNFSGGTDGNGPEAGLTFDASGNLYGTTVEGGVYNSGVVFELSPGADGNWTETVLHSFGTGDDGNAPKSELIFDRTGNLYGTTIGSGGTRRGGIVFKLTPTTSGWTETILYSFPASIAGPDGDVPIGGVVMDAKGNLYGNTESGGLYGYGAIYKLTPQMDGSYKESIIHDFNGYDGVMPDAGIVMDGKGNLFGTTIAGGYASGCGGGGCGVVYELSHGSNGAWNMTVVRDTTVVDAGVYPVGPVSFDWAGNAYAASLEGGRYLNGTVFMLTPTASGPWKEKLLHAFDYKPPNGTDGAAPYAGVIFRYGRVLGTTALGGGPDNSGTAFEIAVPK